MQEDKIIIILNPGTPIKKTLHLSQKLTNFCLHPIQSDNYSTPFQIPQSLTTSQIPFLFIQKYAASHSYNPTSPQFKLPVSTTRYQDIVDPITYDLCARFTDLGIVAEAEEIIRVAKWLQFRELETAIGCAIAVNLYVEQDQRSIQEFMKKHNLEDISYEQIQQIYYQHKDFFDYIEHKTKQQFITSQNPKQENPNSQQQPILQ